MTGALWAKRGERDISRGARHEREARDEVKIKIMANRDMTTLGLAKKWKLPRQNPLWSNDG